MDEFEMQPPPYPEEWWVNWLRIGFVVLVWICILL